MPYTIPARFSQRTGKAIPEIVVDDEFADVVKQTKWSLGTKGYVCGMPSVEIGIIRLHRYLWLLKYGECPKELDHRNRDKLDNRLENLRPASGTLNTLNKSAPSGKMPPGVALRPRQKSRPYQGHVSFRGKWVSLGLYATPEEAHAVHVAMKFMLVLVESALCA
jgi:hypothetical protein